MHLEYGLRNERKSPVFSCLRSSFDLKQVCLVSVAGDEIDPLNPQTSMGFLPATLLCGSVLPKGF